MKNKVTILRGIPGAGKSTYIAKNLNDNLIMSADLYFMKEGRYVFDRSKLGEAHASCLRAFLVWIQAGVDGIVVDNTNITGLEIAPYAALALAYGYELEIVTLKVDFLTAHSRNVHGVPLASVRRMAERLEIEGKHFPPYWPHRVVESHMEVQA